MILPVSRWTKAAIITAIIIAAQCDGIVYASVSVNPKQKSGAITEPLLRAHLIVNLLRYIVWEKPSSTNSTLTNQETTNQLAADQKTTDQTAAQEIIDGSIKTTSPIRVCIVGRPYSMDELLKLNGATINNQQIEITVPDTVGGSEYCDATILGPHATIHNSSEQNLNICDECTADIPFYTIKLLRIENTQAPQQTTRAGFEVNLAQAKIAGITFSSALLEHATNIVGTD